MAEFTNNAEQYLDTTELDYYSVLEIVQNKLIQKNSILFSEKETTLGKPASEEESAKRIKVKNMISFLIDKEHLSVMGMSKDELIENLYKEMVGFSILTDYIEDKNNEIEEINVNAWNDIEIRYSNGDVKKAEHFYNQQHCENVLNRLVTAANATMDEAMPMAEGSLSNNIRAVILRTPIVDKTVGAACSIRLLKPNFATRDFFINNGTCTAKELDFLELAIRSGVSVVFVGETGCGKTTLMNYLLGTIPNNKRVVTIEHNARELSLIKTDTKGNVINNVVHMQTRPHEKKDQDVSQEDLVVKALRLDPNVICVGEMRDTEAYAAQEASLTGHTVVTSLHADGVSATHFRIAMLAIKKYPVDINIALLQAAMAFPVVVYLSKLQDNSRHIMEISECSVLEDASGIIRDYTSLFEYEVTSQEIINGKYKIKGKNKENPKLSKGMQKRMMQNGATASELQHFGFC